MVELSRPHAGVVGPLSPEAALAVLRHIMNVWELDWLDATALVGGTTNDMKTIEWTEDRRLRAAYLSELEKALIGLNPKTGIARWIATPNPGPDPWLIEANVTVDIVNPGQPYAAFATNFLDIDNDPGFLGVPASAAGFRHELPNRYLIYSE